MRVADLRAEEVYFGKARDIIGDLRSTNDIELIGT